MSPEIVNISQQLTSGDRRLKVAVVSKADLTGGGASRVAQELTELLSAKGHIAHHWLLHSGVKDHIYMREIIPKRRRVFRVLNDLQRRIGLPNFFPFELFFFNSNRLSDYDIIHFHDISSVISPWTIFWLSRFKPIVWTFHDCSPFTAGCISSMDCTKYIRGCGECPQLGRWPLDTSIDLTRVLAWSKRVIGTKRTYIPVVPSQWMQEKSFGSGYLPSQPVLIPNAIDTDLFCPQDRNIIRKKLELPLDRTVVTISAAYLEDDRKGAKFALQALHACRDLAPFVLLVGRSDPRLIEQLNGLDYLATGYISDRERLAQYYSAADIFLYPSLADNLPLVVLENLSCGVPVVAFSVGGIPEMIDSSVGRLVALGDIESLSLALREMLTTHSPNRWTPACRARVEQKFSRKTFIRKHEELYTQILK